MKLKLLTGTALVLFATTAAPASGPSPATPSAGVLVIVPLEAPPLTFGPGINAEQALAATTGAALSWSASEAVPTTHG